MLGAKRQMLSAGLAAAAVNAVADKDRHGVRFAGLMLDIIFSSDGVYADPPGFLAPVLANVHAHGAGHALSWGARLTCHSDRGSQRRRSTSRPTGAFRV
jgi:hypothetical protein